MTSSCTVDGYSSTGRSLRCCGGNCLSLLLADADPDAEAAVAACGTEACDGQGKDSLFFWYETYKHTYKHKRRL